MAITNRKGVTYYLHEGVTKTGKPKYFLSTKRDGKLREAVPEGYELYEDPNAQVFCRKVPPKVIQDDEVLLVKRVLRQQANTPYFIVDVRGPDIIVHAADDDLDNRMDLLSAFGAPRESTLRFMEQHLRYMPMLRFHLIDKADRVFEACRWCFLGSIDDWFPLDSGSLGELIDKYAPHLGAESFFDLM